MNADMMRIAATAEHSRDPQLAAWFERPVNAPVSEQFFPEEVRARGTIEGGA
jgi:hypothetical protein